MDSALHDVPSALVCLASTRNVPESQVPLHVAFRTCHSPEHRVSDTDSNSTGTRADEQDFYGIVQGRHADVYPTYLRNRHVRVHLHFPAHGIPPGMDTYICQDNRFPGCLYLHFTGHCGCAAHYAAVLALRDTLTL